MKMKKINVTETIVADIQLHIVQNGSGGLVIFWGMYPHQGGEVEHFWEALLELVPEQNFLLVAFQVEDWNDTSIVQFQEELHQIRIEIENIQDASAATDSKSRFILQDAEGNEVMKYFDAEITDSTSIYLQNMIEEALDDFGDTLEMNQKVAVLVQAIRKLL